MKKLLSVTLCLLMLVSFVPTGVFSITASAATSGTTGDCTWTLNGTVLTISGNGAMENYYYHDFKVPWGKNIAKVIIENGVTSIGQDAFYNCAALTSVTIPDSVISIGSCAFRYCSTLLLIEIPDSVTVIGAYAFDGCRTLTDIIVDTNNTICCDVDGVLFNKDKTAILRYPAGKTATTYSIPDGVTTIGESAFSGCDALETVTVPSGVKTIGALAFVNCIALKTITIPDSVTAIGQDAFYETVYYNDVNNWKNGALYIDNHLIKLEDTFSGAYTVRAGTKTITSAAFSFCTALKTIVIPDSVTTIGEEAFYGCTALKNVWYTDADRSGIFIKDGNNELINATWHYNTCKNEHVYVSACDAYCELCEWVRMGVGEHTYDNDCDAVCVCGYVRVVNPHEYTTSKFNETGHWSECACGEKDAVFSHAYDNDCDITCACGYARVVDPHEYTTSKYDETNHWKECACGEKDTVLPHVYDSWWSPCNICGYIRTDLNKTGDCYWKTDGTILTIGGNGAMADYDYWHDNLTPWGIGITAVIIEDGVTSIGKDAFYNCRALVSVAIGNSVTTIGDSAFEYTALTSVEIPDSVTTIGNSVFYYCFALETVIIPDSVTAIGAGAFAYTAYDSNTSNWENDVLYVGNHLITAKDTVSSAYIVRAGTKTIAGHAFYYCSALKSVTIPDSVATVGDEAFYECTALKDVWYTGTNRSSISIGDGNVDLITATWHYNVPTNGWYKADGEWYRFENGAMVNNAWRKDSVGWVYLGADGAMLTNSWCKDSKGWCYVGANGYAVTNCWKKDSVGWIYLDKNGSMTKSAWVKDGGKWYYLDANGYMAANTWRKDSVGWVYLGSNGAMLTNSWCKDSKGWCYVGADGYAVTNCWKKDSVGWIYLDANGSMTKSAWVQDGGKWYYLDANGYMVANKTLTIGGKKYTFNASGVWVG